MNETVPPRTPSRAPRASYVALPPMPNPPASLLAFLVERFPRVARSVWERRFAEGRVLDEAGQPVRADAPYMPNCRLRYFREVEDEPTVPEPEEILHQDADLLVACKPHFLPVTPSGPWVNECLLYRLVKRTGIADLAPVHRLDRETAGLVMFSTRPETCRVYGDLFVRGEVRRLYEAIARAPRVDLPADGLLVESRIVPGEPWFHCREVEGPVNARTRVRLLERHGEWARFELEALTGKSHQLRIHMARIGCPIANDTYYPVLHKTPKTGMDRPLLLLARELAFRDPLSGEARVFRSRRTLAWPATAPA
jgi:tRNA pseudouridine32 synthase/23S rRNA pseudouridine746 synthase